MVGADLPASRHRNEAGQWAGEHSEGDDQNDINDRSRIEPFRQFALGETEEEPLMMKPPTGQVEARLLEGAQRVNAACAEPRQSPSARCRLY